jgi:hypothetical protein
MRTVTDIELDRFLRDYPLMAIRPIVGSELRIKGKFAFSALHPTHGPVTDSFDLEIIVPPGFPRELPAVRETAKRIPRHVDFHVNGDGSICLGSDLRLLTKISGDATLSGFASRCIIPYLYAMSLKLKNGGDFVFGELAHYGPGMLQDYAQLFSLRTIDQARYALELLAKRKRIANKRPCPCGCKLRLGRCRFRYSLLRLRRLTSRAWFRRQLAMAGGGWRHPGALRPRQGEGPQPVSAGKAQKIAVRGS